MEALIVNVCHYSDDSTFQYISVIRYIFTYLFISHVALIYHPHNSVCVALIDL